MRTIVLCAAALGLSTVSAARAAVPVAGLTVVAEDGQHAAGQANGLVYSGFEPPVIDETGHVVLVAGVSGAAALYNAVFRGVPGAISVVAREGDAAPGGAAPWRSLTGAAHATHSTGQLVFSGVVTDTDALHHSGLWAGAAGSIAQVMRDGEAPPGLAGGLTYDRAVIDAAISGAGHVVFHSYLAGPGVVAGNDEALFAGPPGGVALVAREGDAAPGAGGAVFTDLGAVAFNGPRINAGGAILFSGYLAGTGVTERNKFAIWTGPPASIGIAVRGGDVVPGLPGGLSLQSAAAGVLNDAGQILFSGRASDATFTVIKDGIWLGTPGSFTKIAVTGDAMPGNPSGGSVFSGASTLRLNGSGQVAFEAALATGDGLFGYDAAGGIKLLARSDAQAPGMPAGETFGGQFTEAFLNGAGKVLFRNVTAQSSITGLWIGDVATGEVDLVARTGAPTNVGGAQRTFSELLIASGGDSQSGLGSALSDDGNVVFLTTFTDGRRAIVRTGTAPPPPPATNSYLLPTKVAAKFNAKNAAFSKLTVTGVFDIGSIEPCWKVASTLDVGGLHFDIPAFTAGKTVAKKYVYSADGLTLTVTPNAHGSSKAAFALTYVGDLTGKIAADGQFTLRFADDAGTATATVGLAGGKFKLSAPHGGFIDPCLFIGHATAKLLGPGKDTLSLTLGFATDGTPPAIDPCWNVGFGDTFAEDIPAAAFHAGHTAAQRVAKGNFGGITNVTVDYAKQTVSFTGKGLTLGTFAQGANTVLVQVTIGTDVHAVRVVLARAGSSMTY